MKSRLIMFTLAILLVGTTPTFAQDTGIMDTIALELSVDSVALTATLELWVFSDEDLLGASMGFTWANSPTADNFLMDTAISSSEINAGFDLGRFFFENSDKALTNTNQRFLFGASSLFASLPGSATRRLWATYSFDITAWTGFNNEGFLIDTLTFSGGSEYLLIDLNNEMIIPYFAGSVSFGDPALDADDGADEELPTTYALAQNYPNPFNPATEIAFDLPSKSKVRLAVFNILGQEVATLVNKEMGPGHHTVRWDAGAQASGIYFYKIEADNFSETRKMMLIK